MLNFWASWCGVCRRGMPQLEALHQEFSRRGLVLLGVNGESARSARNFVSENGYTFPTVVDSGNKVGNRFRVNAIPTAVVIDREGRIASYLVGLHSEKALRGALARAGLTL
jgi:thiol-disulfide isomerase/thioredoxin